MKKHIGFVSNSSSTSFVFALREANDITTVGDKSLIFISHLEMGEGKNVIEIHTDDTLLLLKHTDQGSVYEYYLIVSEYDQSFDDAYDWNGDFIKTDYLKDNKIEIKEGYEVEMIDWSQHSSRSDFDIIEKYYDYDQNVLEKLKQKVINKKLKKIKNDGNKN